MGSIGNPAEAALAAVLAKLLPSVMPAMHNSGPTSSTPSPASSSPSSAAASAVITFYSEQVRRIQREFNGPSFKNTGNAGTRPTPGVHSVDSFQGSEAGPYNRSNRSLISSTRAVIFLKLHLKPSPETHL